MKKLQQILSFIVFLLLLPNAFASSWMRNSDESYMTLRFNHTRSDHSWDDHRDLKETCQSNDLSTALHYEHGYSYYSTVFANLRNENNRCGDNKLSGLREVKIGVRGRLNKLRNGKTWQLALKIPLKDNSEDISEPTQGDIGLAAGLFFQFLPDHYKTAFTVHKTGVWFTSFGINLWGNDRLASDLWGKIGWKRPLFDSQWRFSCFLRFSNTLGGLDTQIVESDLVKRFDTKDSQSLIPRLQLSHRIYKDYRLSIGMEHGVWGRNKSRSTSVSLNFSKSWG